MMKSSVAGDLIPTQYGRVGQIGLHPGVNARKRGIHQKGLKVYSGKPDIDTDKPLVLSVVSQSKWLKEEEYLQEYAVVVMIRHEATIEIYNRIREQIQQRVRIK